MKPSYELISDLITRKTGVVLDQETKLLIKDLIIDREELKEKIKLLLKDNWFSYEDSTDNMVEGYYPDLEEEILELLESKDNKKES